MMHPGKMSCPNLKEVRILGEGGDRLGEGLEIFCMEPGANLWTILVEKKFFSHSISRKVWKKRAGAHG